MEAFTVYPRPRYRPIVFAFAGDSTITSLPRAAGFLAVLAGFRVVVVFFAVVVVAMYWFVLILSDSIVGRCGAQLLPKSDPKAK
jgi:hypothetical protein